MNASSRMHSDGIVRVRSMTNANESKTTSRSNDHQVGALPVTPRSDEGRSEGGTTLPHNLILLSLLHFSLFFSLFLFYAGRKKGTAAMATVSSWFAYESLHFFLLSLRRDYISNSGFVVGYSRKNGKYYLSHIGHSYNTLI